MVLAIFGNHIDFESIMAFSICLSEDMQTILPVDALGRISGCLLYCAYSPKIPEVFVSTISSIFCKLGMSRIFMAE